MGNFVLAYRGGGGNPSTPEEGEAVMAAWMGWFGELGAAVIDGGAPFGASTSVGAGGDAQSGLTGYSVLAADSLADAAKMAEGCPILSAGGVVDVYEAIAM